MKIGLTLSVGGAKGVGHLAVLEVIEELGLDVSYVSSASMGSIAGGLYSMGLSTKEMNEIFLGFISRKKLKILDFRIPKDSLIAGNRISEVLREVFGLVKFNNLKKKFYPVACDITNGRRKAFNSGVVVDAVEASISVPGIFPPKVIDGIKYVDGGVIDPVPTSVIRDKVDFLIAVKIFPNFHKWNISNKLPILQNMAKSLTIIESNLADLRLKECPPDFLFEIKSLSQYELFDIRSAPEVIEKARKTVRKQLPGLKKALENRARIP